MATVLLLHSIRGLRAVERRAAERWQAEGHRVVTPDLFEGAVPETVEAGFALVEAVGDAALVARAAAAAEGLPAETVLAGLSMGAGIASTLWERRPGTAGVLLLHGIGAPPEAPRPGTPLAAHLAEPDPFEEEWVAWWRDTAAARGLAPQALALSGRGAPLHRRGDRGPRPGGGRPALEPRARLSRQPVTAAGRCPPRRREGWG